MSPQPGVLVRPAAATDVDDLVAMEAEFFGLDAWDAAAVQAELDGAGRRVLVAVLDSEVVGYAVSIAAGDMLDLARIGVRPAQRRGGTASALLDGLLADVGEADRMLLEVASTNAAAIAFYARHGFEAIDVRKRYYRDGSDAVVMLRPLTAAADKESKR